MGKLHWTLEDLKRELNSHPLIKGWSVTQDHVHRRERYFLAENSHLIIDQDRNVKIKNIFLKIMVRVPQSNRQGELSKKLFPSLELNAQIEAAVDAALQTNHQAWELSKTAPQSLPQVLTTDPNMAEDLNGIMNELSERISKQIKKKRKSKFNSAELFLSLHDRELHLSNGLIHRSSQSRIYTEAAFSAEGLSAAGAPISDEYLNASWAVHLNQLPIEEIFDQAAEHAEHSLEVIKPITGIYSVIIDAEVLSTLLNGFISQLSAANAYHGLPFIQTHHPLIPDATGDLLSIALDPTLDYGADTTAVSNQGLPQKPLLLVSNNQVLNTATDQQYGDYLGTQPNTVRGSLVVSPGGLSHEQLTQASPIVIEILQFSGLFADPNSGTFSSEIRLARLYNNQEKTVIYLKGGSLSGSLRENFRRLKLSSATVHRAHFSSDQQTGQGYFGPKYALLSEVSIVG